MRNIHWLGGAATALGGALLTRLPATGDWEIPVHVAGFVLAWCGLAWIAFGVARRARQRPPHNSP